VTTIAQRRLQRGKPVVAQGPLKGGPTANPVHHEFEVTNAGQAAITHLWLWIEDGQGRCVSSGSVGATALPPGGRPVFVAIDVRQPLPDEQRLMVKWCDQDGEHTEDTGIRPRRHAE
jgi:hypothetical protein